MRIFAEPRPRRPETCALAVFAKAPIPGTVKTRLIPPLTSEEAARLHAALVEDTLCRTAALDMVRYLACTPDIRHPFLQACAQRYGARLIAQGAGDLGDRMLRVVKTLLARHGKVLLVGTDSPTLPLEFVAEAEDRLNAADLVFGPSEDGGYYLLGQRRLYPEIFRGVAWGGADVLRATLAKLDPSRVRLLPPWYDVDRPEDLARLRHDLAESVGCERTTAWFRGWRQPSRPQKLLRL
ncbi:MAG: TIGR04282 family arsenosugar biosynthesis glycosyltransferase [Nitrospirota bacterium]